MLLNMAAVYLRSHSDISAGRETVPVKVDDNVCLQDSGLLDFMYTKSNISNLAADRVAELIEQYVGCSCKEENCYLSNSCSCLSRFGPAYDFCHHLLDIVPYTDTLRPVFECNDDCFCGNSCSNRVVQHGVTTMLLVFASGHKGVGVRSLQAITRGSFVCEYSGELLSDDAARRRARNSNPANHNYILTMREHFGTKSLTTYVDATYFGNVGRFINHSCQPNLYIQPVRVENAIPRVAMFALSDIPADTELSYDYSGGVNLALDSGERSMTRKACLCGSSHCKLVLPYDDSLFTS